MSYADSFLVIGKTLAASVSTVAHATAGHLSPTQCNEVIDRWSRAVVEGIGMRIEITGETHSVAWQTPHVMMSNHQSHLDIPVIFRVVPLGVRMIAKAELFKMPLFGRAILDAGFIPVDRGQREQAIASLDAAAARVRGGASVWIAPEGTRSPDGRLGPLKKGGFHLAQRAGAPILPIAIRGTRDALPPGAFHIQHGVTVHVHVGAPIPTVDTTVEDLMRQVQAFLVAHGSPR